MLRALMVPVTMILVSLFLFYSSAMVEVALPSSCGAGLT